MIIKLTKEQTEGTSLKEGQEIEIQEAMELDLIDKNNEVLSKGNIIQVSNIKSLVDGEYKIMSILDNFISVKKVNKRTGDVVSNSMPKGIRRNDGTLRKLLDNGSVYVIDYV